MGVSTANPDHFHPSLAGLAVLFSRQLPNSSHNFFLTFSIFFQDYFIRNPQTTIALPFLTHNISTIGGVICFYQYFLRLLRKFYQSNLLYMSGPDIYNTNLPALFIVKNFIRIYFFVTLKSTETFIKSILTC